MAMTSLSSLASQPLPPMDERYGLLTAIVSSSHDGSAPQHVTFMGPGLELVLQSRPVEPSQARSGVEYVFSIDYQGVTKLRRFLGPGRQQVDIEHSGDMIFSYQQESAAVQVRLRLQVAAQASQALRSMDFTVASISARAQDSIPSYTASSQDRMPGSYMQDTFLDQNPNMDLSQERPTQLAHAPSLIHRPLLGSLGDTHLSPHHALARHASLQPPFRIMSPRSSLNLPLYAQRPPASPMPFGHSTEGVPSNSTHATSMKPPPKMLGFTTPSTPLPVVSEAQTTDGVFLDQMHSSQLDHYRSLMPIRRSMPFAKPAEKPPEPVENPEPILLSESAALEDPVKPKAQMRKSARPRQPAQPREPISPRSSTRSKKAAQPQKQVQPRKPVQVIKPRNPVRPQRTPSPPTLPKTRSAAKLMASGSPLKPTESEDKDKSRCLSCKERNLSCRQWGNAIRCEQCTKKHRRCSFLDLDEQAIISLKPLRMATGKGTTLQGKGRVAGAMGRIHPQVTQPQTRLEPKKMAGSSSKDNYKRKGQSKSFALVEAVPNTRAVTRSSNARKVDTTAITKQKTASSNNRMDSEGASRAVADTNPKETEASLSTSGQRKRPGEQLEQASPSHAALSSADGGPVRSTRKRKRPSRYVDSSDQEQGNSDSHPTKRRSIAKESPSTAALSVGDPRARDSQVENDDGKNKSDKNTTKKPMSPPTSDPLPTPSPRPGLQPSAGPQPSAEPPATTNAPAPTRQPLFPAPLDEGLVRVLWQAAMPPPRGGSQDTWKTRTWEYIQMQGAVLDTVSQSRVVAARRAGTLGSRSLTANV